MARSLMWILLIQLVSLGAGCEEFRSIDMPEDTMREGLGLFTGDRGYFDLTELSGINQSQVITHDQYNCSSLEKTQEDCKNQE